MKGAAPAPAPAPAPAKPASSASLIERPVFIMSSPRSGSTLLFETLAQAPGLYTVGGESHGIIEGIEQFRPATRDWHSNRLTADDAAPEPTEQLARAFYDRLKDRDGRPATGQVRMLEKTPKNALRLPFLNAMWPDADYVYLYRDPRQTLSSMMEAWRSGGFRTYPQLPGWQGDPWSLLLVPGWQRLIGQPLPVIVAAQWKTTTDILLDDLAQIPPERVRVIDYDEFLASPQTSMEALAASLGLGWDRTLGDSLPLSKHTVSRPKADKWRTNEKVIESIWPIVEATAARARRFVEGQRTGTELETNIGMAY